jgi:P27 family predicted phage terminase small subunit
MPGPAPRPAYLKVLRGNPGKKRIPREVEPEIPATIPQAPAFLSGHAREEWDRVAPSLHRLRLLSDLDLQVLAAYCQSYGRWRQAEEALATMAARDQTTNALLVKGRDGGPTQNPLVRVSTRAAADMIAAASHFGMTPGARSRIAAGIGHEPPDGGKFKGLIA